LFACVQPNGQKTIAVGIFKCIVFSLLRSRPSGHHAAFTRALAQFNQLWWFSAKLRGRAAGATLV
jgi:hypothetical protein